MRIVIIYILLIVSGGCAIAQEHFIEKPAKLLTKFHFRQLTGGVMLINGRLGNVADTLNFILDTGSGGISLDSTTCEEYHIPHSPSGRTINGIAGIKDVDFAQNHILQLPGLQVEGLDFYINDYEILSEVYGEKIDGIIGYSFFSKYIVKVNVDSLMIEVYSPGEMKYPPHGYLMRPLFTTLPIEPVKIIDSRRIAGSFYIDTGAGLSLLMSESFVKDSSVFKSKRKLLVTQAEGLGGKKRMKITIVRQIRFGPYIFRKVPAYILDDKYNVTSYPYLGGLVGNEIFKRFNIVFNYPKREIHLMPNSHFEDAFEYSYIGMSLYFINDKVVIDDIIPDSPADTAGFKKDDIIISVGNNLSNNLITYKSLILAATDKLKVIVKRSNTPLIIHFKPGRIY
jgi:hypothetical protein